MCNIKYVVTSVETLISNEESKSQFEDLLKLQWLEVDHRRKSSDLDVDFDTSILRWVSWAYTS